MQVKPMTEADWLAGRLRPMLRYVCSKATMRQRRLLACGYCRLNWSRLPDDRLKAFIELIERYADGKGHGAALVRAYELIGVVKKQLGSIAFDRDILKALHAAQATGEDPPGVNFPQLKDSDVQVALLHEIFGNPFRPPAAPPAAVLAWSTGTVRRLAEGIYVERRTPTGTLDGARLAILADALLEAGCDNKEIIQHCRGEGPHVRGCWALDWILGKS
jgi:hypothetical protein